MIRIVALVAFWAMVCCLETLGAEAASFALVEFPVPEGWTRHESQRAKTIGLMLHGGKTEEEADGMIQLDIGLPTAKTLRELAEVFAGKDGTIDPNPIKLDGVEVLRVTTPSNDFTRPKLGIIAIHEGRAFFLAAAAKPGFDPEPALKSIIETWRWHETDQKRLGGEWKIERVEVGGKAIADPGVPTEMVFRDGFLTLSLAGKSTPTMSDLLVVVDTKAKPAKLNLVRGLRETLPCLYEVEADRLTIVMPLIPKDKKPEDALARPTGFDSNKEPIMVMTAKRVPNKDEPPKAPEK